MGSSRALPAESERERALLATAELWSEAGYGGLSAAAISERAGIEAGTFASLFANLEAAAQATFEAPIGAVVGLVAEQFAPDRSEPESCMRGIVAILEVMAANPAFAFVVYLGRRQAVPEAVRASAKTGHGFIVAMLERLRDSSAVTGQPLGAGVGALGAAEILLRREVLAGRADRLTALAPTVVYAAISPFVGQEEGLRLARESRRLLGPAGEAKPL